MTPARPDLLSDFDGFAARVESPALLDPVARDARVEPEWLAERIRTSLAEARHTLGFLAAELRPGQRLLEVGAGLGLTSGFLASTGHAVTSIEPGGEGFEDYARANPAIRAALDIEHPHHEVAVEEITSERIGGPFDLIFSNNVLEHVLDVEVALERLDSVLAPGGLMVHSCPNYTTPYEPHFGIPLVPVRPALTEKLLPDRISDTGLWRSLNFVTARQVRAVGDRLGRDVELVPGVLADALERLGDDEAFASRHPGLARFPRAMRVAASLVRRLPPTLTTPVVFRWRRPAAA